MAVGIGITYGGIYIWSSIRSGNLTAMISSSVDGTSVSGFTRQVRYSASQEENLIDNANWNASRNSSTISAKSYIVVNEKDMLVVASRTPDRLLPIASLTKLVTAAVAHKYLADDAIVTISGDIISTYGNTAEFKIGENFFAKDLLYPLLMVSSNDAAEALARTYGRKKFIEKMNEFAQSIGAYRTHFVDPSGLSPDNVSTARDFAIILTWLNNYDHEIVSITDLKSKTARVHTWTNPAHFLNWSNYIGGKNGYTEEANQTAAALFSMNDNRDIYTVVVLGSSARDNDMIKLLAKI